MSFTTSRSLDLDPDGAGFTAVVYGHSHKPVIEKRGKLLFVNPGSAGPRRFSLPVTAATLAFGSGRCEAKNHRARILATQPQTGAL